ncbi:MAG: hypothetical protein CL678_15615 [Bdellovibrionaceae bacterium]|nr:hypothetical protein [Pseudobdellovibrionaceae bacterium]|tara:strand:+ start:394 stop:753 length:360 start_codon:yes stop_codon:yes gene_type:complete
MTLKISDAVMAANHAKGAPKSWCAPIGQFAIEPEDILRGWLRKMTIDNEHWMYNPEEEIWKPIFADVRDDHKEVIRDVMLKSLRNALRSIIRGNQRIIDPDDIVKRVMVSVFGEDKGCD